MKKEERIRKGYEFKKIFEKGKAYPHQLATVYFLENTKSRPRVGVLTSKRLGKAVFRNRIRRLFKEGFRQIKDKIKDSVDVVIIPRARSKELSLKQISQGLEEVFKKAGVLNV